MNSLMLALFVVGIGITGLHLYQSSADPVAAVTDDGSQAPVGGHDERECRICASFGASLVPEPPTVSIPSFVEAPLPILVHQPSLIRSLFPAGPLGSRAPPAIS